MFSSKIHGKGKQAAASTKLIEDDKGKPLYKLINAGYSLWMIVCGFSKKILWVGSCLAFMYLMPNFLEIMSE
jgi:hypothetical protein